VDLLRGLAIFFRVDESRQRAPAQSANSLYGRSGPANWLAFWCGTGSPGCRYFFAISGFLITTTALRRWGKLFASQLARVLPDAFRPHRAAVDSATGHSQHSSFCTAVPDFMVTAKRRALARSFLPHSTFHVNLLEAIVDTFPGNWGHSVVAFRRGDVLFFLSFAQ